MGRCPLPRHWVHGTDEFHIMTKVFQHACMLAADWTGYHVSSRQLRYCSCCAYGYCAIDDGQCGLEQLDVTRCLPGKVLNTERVADVQDIHVLDPLLWRVKVQSHGWVMFADEFKQGPADLAESNDNYLLLFLHRFTPPNG